MKIINFDALYDVFVKEFISAKKGKYTESELEDLQPKLYEKFSSLKIKNIGNLTPSEYYDSQKDKLLDILKEHIRREISINDFLLSALSKHISEDILIENLNENFSSEYLLAIITVLSIKGSKKAINRYIDLLFVKNLDKETEDALVELLKDEADFVAKYLNEKSADFYPNSICEVLSYCVNEKSVASKILQKEFEKNLDKIPEYVSYIVKLDDESALDILYKIIESEEISYIDFKELKLAIEALGGYYEKERDFSFDKNYKLLKGE